MTHDISSPPDSTADSTTVSASESTTTSKANSTVTSTATCTATCTAAGSCTEDAADNPVAGESFLTVSLWAAKIPFIGIIADHHWFVIDRNGSKSRWEVWQKPDACGSSWGHLNLNLLPATSGVGNGDAQHLQQWTGTSAQALADRIEASPAQYPWCHKYRYWPGPNSNTYVQWVLLGEHLLGSRAPGKQYCRLFA